MPHMSALVRDYWRDFKMLPLSEQAHRGLFWSFACYILIFATGYGTREVMPLVCLIFLLVWYATAWHRSALRRFGGWWLFLFFFATSIWGTVFSGNVWESFLHVGRSVNKGFILPFIAMECVRKERDLRILVVCMALAFCWQGLDGVWQTITGHDFVHGTPPAGGRLSGSLSDYRVGNYMALLCLPAMGVWWVARGRYARSVALGLTVLLFAPGVYLMYFAYTRNAYIAVMAGLCLWLFVCRRSAVGDGWRNLLRRNWNWQAAMGIALVVLLWNLSQEQRFGMEGIAQDGRWDLWRLAWAVAGENFITGVGFGQYNAAFRALGLAPTRDPISISHPHSIYAQLLCESGVVGLALCLVFLIGMLVWTYRRVRPALLAELDLAERGLTRRCHWRMTGLLWCAWGAYLVSGIVGHDFYRMWWQSLVMAHLGVLLGAIVNGPLLHRKAPPPPPGRSAP